MELHRFDSRRWTGPEPAAPKLDRPHAMAAFRSAGGQAAVLPQRVASAVIWLGFAPLVVAALLGPAVEEPLAAIDPAKQALRTGLRAMGIAGRSGEGGAFALADPRVFALLLALAGSLTGILLAWKERRALAEGFRAAEAGTPGAVFLTRRADLVAPLLGLGLIGASLEERGLSLSGAVVLGVLALLAVRAATSVAERWFAGLGSRLQHRSRWDAVSLLASIAIVAVLLLHALARRI